MAARASLRPLRPAFPALLALLGAIGCTGCVAAETGGDALAWLKKIAAASRQMNYAGTFVYQHGRKMETSRIAHRVDAGGEYEKLETLDGPAREIIRNNDNVTCYLPDTKTVIIEKRTTRQFPVLLLYRLVAALNADPARFEVMLHPPLREHEHAEVGDLQNEPVDV